MIKANHKKFWVWFSILYTNFFLRIIFRNLRYIGENKHENLPVLIISNHFSWWDGFIQILLNVKYFHKKYHFMMLEKELRKSMILTTAGAFSIEKGTRRSIESLQYSAELLKDSENMFLFFPQGEIKSIYTNKFVFEKGVLDYIFKKVKNEFQFVFNVNLIDYSAYRRPELSMYFKTYTYSKTLTADDVERDFNEFANECMAKQRGE